MPGPTFKAALEGHRNTLFCGRVQALAQLDTFFAAPAPRVCHLYGPGGIGKTYLLRHWLGRRALESGQTFWLDAAEVAATPKTIEDAFAPARTDGAALRLVVVDNYHHWGALDGFARDSVLGALPAHLHVVIAGRNYPDASWLGDAGWQALTDLLCLQPLAVTEASELLALLRVADQQRPALQCLAAGNPLGLTLGATLARNRALDEAGSQGFANRLALRSLVTELTQALGLARLPQHQWEAIEYGALAGYMDEALLRTRLNDRAGEAMAWLRRLTIVETTGLGLRLIECYRRAVLLRSHFETPHRLLEVVEACADEHLRRAVDSDTARWIEALPAVTQAAEAIGLAHDPLRAATQALDAPYRLAACNDAAVAPLVAGSGSRERFAARLHKLAQHRFILVAREDPERPLAAVFSLPFTANSEMDKLRGAFDLRAGDAPPDLLAALPMAAEVADAPGLARQLLLCALARHLCKASPAGTLLLFPVQLDVAAAAPGALELRQARGAGLQGWRGLWLGARQAGDRDHALRLLYALHGGHCKRGNGVPANGTDPAEPMDAAAFKLAVVEALHHYTDARRLAQNPIAAGARASMAQAGGERGNGEAQDGVFALRALLRAAVERLGAAPRNHKLLQALEATYLAPRGQKTAAAEMNMAYSTFRRHLRDAREMVAEELWQQELGARR